MEKMPIILISGLLAIFSVTFSMDLRPSCVTDSMFPTIKCGDIITTIRDDSVFYGIGDIIAFRIDPNNPWGYRWAVHRVIGLEWPSDGPKMCSEARVEAYITQGDNSPRPDSYPVTKDRIIGKVVKIY